MSKSSFLTLLIAVKPKWKIVLNSYFIRRATGTRNDRRLPPEQFYELLPAEAVTVDIRSHPYSPFAPNYTGSGVRLAVERWKPGEKTFYHVPRTRQCPSRS